MWWCPFWMRNRAGNFICLGDWFEWPPRTWDNKQWSTTHPNARIYWNSSLLNLLWNEHLICNFKKWLCHILGFRLVRQARNRLIFKLPVPFAQENIETCGAKNRRICSRSFPYPSSHWYWLNFCFRKFKALKTWVYWLKPLPKRTWNGSHTNRAWNTLTCFKI